MKIGIGTAQFGPNYGVTNKIGTLCTEAAHLILDTAITANIANLDTAPGYGNSEKIIGQHSQKSKFKITTKTGHISDELFTEKNVSKIIKEFKQSLCHLGVGNCYGLLLHNPEDLKKKNFKLLVKSLEHLKRDGFVEKIGVSAYNPTDLELASQSMNVDIVQIPLSILNQKFMTTNYLEKLKKNNVEIHARSVFLQGLILATPSMLPQNLEELRPALELVWKEAKNHNVTVQQLAMQYLRQTGMVDVAVIGFTSAYELKQICEPKDIKSIDTRWTKFNFENGHSINPANWKLGH